MSASWRASILIVLALSLLGSVNAATLLADHFGVNLSLSYIQDWEYAPGQTYSGYYFNRGSFAPTLNTTTVDYQVNDWFGQWTSAVGGSLNGITHPDFANATLPAGAEPYDTEAYYFDDDEDNLYFATILGFPSPATGIYRDSRNNVAIVQGDFAIDLVGQGSGVTDNWGFQYDYGVNVTDEIRPPVSGLDVTGLHSDTLGNMLYQTNSGWYLGSPNWAANPVPGNPSGSFTNFDPTFSGLSALGAVQTSWYELPLFNQLGQPVLEDNWATYVLEITIPRALLPPLDTYQEIRFHWLAGCRNDANDAQGYLTGSGITPEPTTAALLLLGIAPLGAFLRRRHAK